MAFFQDVQKPCWVQYIVLLFDAVSPLGALSKIWVLKLKTSWEPLKYLWLSAEYDITHMRKILKVPHPCCSSFVWLEMMTLSILLVCCTAPHSAILRCHEDLFHTGSFYSQQDGCSAVLVFTYSLFITWLGVATIIWHIIHKSARSFTQQCAENIHHMETLLK